MEGFDDSSELLIMIDKSTMVFNPNTARDQWHLPDEPLFGTVGCFTADRCLPWNCFIVFAFNKETHIITAAFPRIRVNKDGSVDLGQDTLTEDEEDTFTCQCSDNEQGCDGICRCGAADARLLKYHDTFKVMPSDTMYTTKQFVHYKFRKFNWVYHQFVCKRDVNNIL